jgi:predicted branched-subunit amino acid permease
MSAQASAFRLGAREAIGAPIAVIAANYLGFGAFASTTDVPLWVVVVSTVSMWALPGQLVMVDAWHVGAPLVAVLLTVMLTNARFLPMTITLLPLLRDRSHPQWRYYVGAHFIAMLAWAFCMRRCPELPAVDRMAYLVGHSTVCIAVACVAGACGYLAAGSIPPAIQLGLVFLAPVNFVIILVGDVKERLGVLALVCGATAGPLLYLVTPQWSLPLAGFGGGTLAYVLNRLIEARRV